MSNPKNEGQFELGYTKALKDVDEVITGLFKFHNDGKTLVDNLNVLNDTIMHIHQALEVRE